MKAKVIIAIWLISLMMLATDSLLQAGIAMFFFVSSSYQLKRCEIEAIKEIKKLENRIDNLINK